MKGYLSILFVSEPVLAANNRGENNGNVQTLQTFQTKRGDRTLLSGGALRYAQRTVLQDRGLKVWRRVVPTSPDNPVGLVYGDNASPTMAKAQPKTPEGFVDASYGWMIATKGKADEAYKRASDISVSAATSGSSYQGSKTFRQGHSADAGKSGTPVLAPFQQEQHWTRYQFLMTVNLDEVPLTTLEPLLGSLKGLQVGGNHGGSLTELIPALLVWRFHKVRGQSGLYLGLGIDFSADETVNLTPLHQRAANLGYTFDIAGLGQEMTVAKALDQMLEVAGEAV